MLNLTIIDATVAASYIMNQLCFITWVHLHKATTKGHCCGWLTYVKTNWRLPQLEDEANAEEP